MKSESPEGGRGAQRAAAPGAGADQPQPWGRRTWEGEGILKAGGGADVMAEARRTPARTMRLSKELSHEDRREGWCGDRQGHGQKPQSEGHRACCCAWKVARNLLKESTNALKSVPAEKTNCGPLFCRQQGGR